MPVPDARHPHLPSHWRIDGCAAAVPTCIRRRSRLDLEIELFRRSSRPAAGHPKPAWCQELWERLIASPAGRWMREISRVSPWQTGAIVNTGGPQPGLCQRWLAALGVRTLRCQCATPEGPSNPGKFPTMPVNLNPVGRAFCLERAKHSFQACAKILRLAQFAHQFSGAGHGVDGPGRRSRPSWRRRQSSSCSGRTRAGSPGPGRRRGSTAPGSCHARR